MRLATRLKTSGVFAAVWLAMLSATTRAHAQGDREASSAESERSPASGEGGERAGGGERADSTETRGTVDQAASEDPEDEAPSTWQTPSRMGDKANGSGGPHPLHSRRVLWPSSHAEDRVPPATRVDCVQPLAPAPAAPPPGSDDPPRYEVSPVVDGAVVAMATGFAAFSELTIRSGELQPQAPTDPSRLLAIDRWVTERGTAEEGSGLASDLVVAGAFTYAAIDSVRTGFREDRSDAIAELWMYAESAALNWAVANMSKLGIRRPRPIAYAQLRQTGQPPQATDDALSFYSLHTALVSGLSTTATYLAFARNPRGIEGWVTLGGGVVATTFVGIQRVRALAHFPTDVMAGAFVGAGIGLLVPYLHRSKDPNAWRANVSTDAHTAAQLIVSKRF